MKTKTLVVIGMTLGMLGAAHAEEPKKAGPKRPLPPEVVAKYDTDGDGKLDETERAAAKAGRDEMMAARKAEILKKYDADGDGELSDSEKATAKAARNAELMAKYDADGDGKLNKEEKAKAKAEMGRPGSRGKKGGDE